MYVLTTCQNASSVLATTFSQCQLTLPYWRYYSWNYRNWPPPRSLKSCSGLPRVACRTGLGVIFVSLFRRAKASARRPVERQTRATEGIYARNLCRLNSSAHQPNRELSRSPWTDYSYEICLYPMYTILVLVIKRAGNADWIIFNNYSSSPNGLWVNSPWGREE